MEVLDPGHKYRLESFDGDESVVLTFVKRNNPPEKYPGNVDAYPGTQTQEVLRALIDRCQYVNDQQPCKETVQAIGLLRQVIELFEHRHSRRHGMEDVDMGSPIEVQSYCATCGHIICFCRSKV